MLRSVDERLRADLAEVYKEKAGLLDFALCRRMDVLTCNSQRTPLNVIMNSHPLRELKQKLKCSKLKMQGILCQHHPKHWRKFGKTILHSRLGGRYVKDQTAQN